MAHDRVIQAGSVRSVFRDLPIAGEPHRDDPFEVQLILRCDPAAGALPSLEALAAQPLAERDYITIAEFARQYRASADDIAAVMAFARDYGLTACVVDRPRHSLKLAGTTQALNAAFGVKLVYFQLANRTCRGHREDISLPADIAPIVEGIQGLDDFPTGHCQAPVPIADDESTSAGPPRIPGFTPPQLAELYDFPAELDGAGECIAILALGGGYDSEVLASYFRFLGVPMPAIAWVNAGAENHYDPADKLTQEVMMDIEIAGAIAPGARIVVYFGPADGYTRTLHAALTDTDHNPSVVSMSFSSPEILMTAPELALYDRLARDAALKGITLCAASGDTGSNISASAAQSPLGFVNNLALVNFPPAHPGVLGCGGTALRAANGRIENEVAYNGLGWLYSTDPADPGLPANFGATGGGVSILYPVPAYQQTADVAGATDRRVVYEPSLVQKQLRSPWPVPRLGRGVPDVAGLAIGYRVLIKGQAPRDLALSGGTSATTPLWAGLIARLNQGLKKRLGFLNPILYNDLDAGALRRITRGSNGAYDARPELRWNACTGLGAPNGVELLRQLRGLAAGRPALARPTA